MKILHVISGGDRGGAKTHVINLLKELKKNIEVDLVCFMEDVFSQEARKEKINIEVIPQKTRFDINAVKKLVEKINIGKYDVIHCHGARANFIGALIKPFCKTPIVTTIHSDYKLDFKDNFLKDIVFTNINSISLRAIDYYIGVSDSFKTMMVERNFPKEKVYTVYNGISFDDEIDYLERKAFLKSFEVDYSEEYIYVGIMGRLHPVKGHKVFLEGAKKAYDENKNLRFLIAGNGEEEENLKEYSKELGIEKVTYFLGFLNNPYDFFNAIDINTLTSYSESFPYVILEGAILKKPTISSDVGGIKDMIKDRVTGCIFAKGDSDFLSKKIIELANYDELRKELGLNLYNFIKSNYSTKHMAKMHMEVYSKIINDYYS